MAVSAEGDLIRFVPFLAVFAAMLIRVQGTRMMADESKTLQKEDLVEGAGNIIEALSTILSHGDSQNEDTRTHGRRRRRNAACCQCRNNTFVWSKTGACSKCRGAVEEVKPSPAKCTSNTGKLGNISQFCKLKCANDRKKGRNKKYCSLQCMCAPACKELFSSGRDTAVVEASTDTCPDFVFSGYCASNHTLNCYDTAGGPPTGQIPQCGVNDAYTCPSGMKKCHKVVVQASTDTCPDFVFSGYCASHHTLNCYDPAGGPPTGQIPQCGVNDAYNCPHGMKKCHKANGSAEDINEVAEDVEGSDGAEDDQIPDDMDNVEGQNVDKDKGVADVIKGMTQTLKTDIGAEGMPAVGPLPVAGPPSAAGPAEDVDMDKLGGIDDMIKGMTQALKKPPTIAMGPKGQEQLFTGHTDCPCVTSDDVDPDRTGSGALEEVKVEGRKAKYPVLRAQCDAWDNGRYPGKCEDTGQSPGKDQGFCKLKWCYVDACNCKLAIPPSKSAYKAEGTYKGRPLYFSYATCGNAPEVGTAVSEAQCEMQSNKETCDMIKDCAWTGLNCMRQDLVDLCMREGVNVSSSDEDGDSDIGNILDHVKAATTPGSKGISSGDQGIPASPLNGDLQERREDTRQQKRSPVIVLSSLPGVAVNTPGSRG